jgi:hypothetical protein
VNTRIDLAESAWRVFPCMSPLSFLFLSFGTNDDIPDQVFSKLLDQPQLMPLWWYGDKSRQQSFPLIDASFSDDENSQTPLRLGPSLNLARTMGKWRAESHTEPCKTGFPLEHALRISSLISCRFDSIFHLFRQINARISPSDSLYKLV